ncbi:MAG: hypothetical protein LUE98_11355 [Tannerellaceae bacterium]|nr:hypothetical protein [Tannerellaceae bacterium]
MKEIIEDLINCLKEELPECRTVEVDWGQLTERSPQVVFPCVLVDLEKIGYSNLANGYQMAEPEISLVVAVQTPGQPATAEEQFERFILTEKIHDILQYYTNGDYSPLLRKEIQKLEGGKGYHGYKIIYQTTYQVAYDNGYLRTGIDEIKLNFI